MSQILAFVAETIPEEALLHHLKQAITDYETERLAGNDQGGG